MTWDEINVHKSLPPHPNIVPIDRIVLEDVESRVVGFTTKYIPGGTLEANPHLPLRFEWLKQLTQLVDFLNLDLGIMHQDIAPRNLIIHPETEQILLFDFGWVAHGKKNLLEGRDDVIGVAFTLYELITGDTHFTSIPHWDRNMDMVLNTEWICNRELDSDLTTFRNFLDEWILTRRIDGDMERYLNAPNRLTWPDLPTPPDYNVPFECGRAAEGEAAYRTGLRLIRTAIKLGQYVFPWQRPPQSRLKESRNEVGE
ncbi:hypothetical protein BU24DRAFT_421809 [Aaosphaeria arxii CBS 175.79]|uniref:EKC/KEOPS complex subunit BUD32 n=1 Tax=Aaosphaeria arxii CBS 175.79 TaxID=1450172 RepID=A0A6A5XTD5_9PLEO|nr:uncharacterized protein BU24DRAFT_421809 [Aaosphaeria arxii CBS 175.79]KAF2015504.1 hypothetical protein BU24DRAFT_421809 [Aaosphaeria arxii CBS 175.79]